MTHCANSFPPTGIAKNPYVTFCFCLPPPFSAQALEAHKWMHLHRNRFPPLLPSAFSAVRLLPPHPPPRIVRTRPWFRLPKATLKAVAIRYLEDRGSTALASGSQVTQAWTKGPCICTPYSYALNSPCESSFPPGLGPQVCVPRRSPILWSTHAAHPPGCAACPGQQAAVQTMVAFDLGKAPTRQGGPTSMMLPVATNGGNGGMGIFHARCAT